MALPAPIFTIVLMILVLGITPDAPPRSTPPDEVSKAESSRITERSEGPATSLIRPGLPNLFRIDEELYSGGQPAPEIGFESLKRLGVRTVVSVDGARPALESAHRAGLSYVHVPIGYDGIDREALARLVRALQLKPGPFYIHCHHGQHRGPAAAAVLACERSGWSRERAAAWLKQAGTSTRYRGLFRDVARFESPAPDTLRAITPNDLPEAVEADGIVEVMVAVGHHWDHLEAIQEAGGTVPPDRPDLDPPHEVLMLRERFVELRRNPDPAYPNPDDFLEPLDAAIASTIALETHYRIPPAERSAEVRRGIDVQMRRLKRSCLDCHARHRDHGPSTRTVRTPRP